MYRNYNGHGATFGDTSISATTSDVAGTSVYAGNAARWPDNKMNNGQ